MYTSSVSVFLNPTLLTYSMLRHFWLHLFKVMWNFFILGRVIFENLSAIHLCIIYSTMCSCLFSRWTEVFFEWNLDSWPTNNIFACRTIRWTIITTRFANVKRARTCLNFQLYNFIEPQGGQIFAEIVEKILFVLKVKHFPKFYVNNT